MSAKGRRVSRLVETLEEMLRNEGQFIELLPGEMLQCAYVVERPGCGESALSLEPRAFWFRLGGGRSVRTAGQSLINGLVVPDSGQILYLCHGALEWVQFDKPATCEARETGELAAYVPRFAGAGKTRPAKPPAVFWLLFARSSSQ